MCSSKISLKSTERIFSITVAADHCSALASTDNECTFGAGVIISFGFRNNVRIHFDLPLESTFL